MHRFSLLLVAMMVLLAGFGFASGEQEAGTSAEGESLTFGYVAGVQDPFQVLIQKGAEEKAKEYDNVEVVAQIPGDWSVDIQAPMWRAMATRGVDAVFGVPVDREALIPVLRDVHERGTPVMTVDTFIGDGDYTSGPESFVLSGIATDNIAAGEMAGHKMAELIGEEGKVFVSEFQVGVSTSDQRTEGFRQAIAEYPDIEIVGSASADNDPDVANTQVTAALRSHDDLAGVYGNNLFACMGAARAVDSAGLNEAIAMVGFDVDPEIADMIRSGMMDAAVSQRPFDIGQRAVEVAYNAVVEGEDVPKDIKLDAVLFTPENIDDEDMQVHIYQ